MQFMINHQLFQHYSHYCVCCVCDKHSYILKSCRFSCICVCMLEFLKTLKVLNAFSFFSTLFHFKRDFILQ
jgi:hypothetical protein